MLKGFGVNMDCIFCKIVKGEVPSYKIYEDENVLAFLDINPVNKGHTLVIPKKHYENIYDISDKDLENVTMVTKTLAKKYKKVCEADGFTIQQANEKAGGQVVFHYHVHLIPRYDEDDLVNFKRKDEIAKEVEETYKKIKEMI